MIAINISSEWITAIITMLGTIFAGAGLKAVDTWLSRASAKAKVDSELREEYRDTISDKRQDIKELKDEIAETKKAIDSLEEEVTHWKTKYFSELADKMELLARLRALEERYKND